MNIQMKLIKNMRFGVRFIMGYVGFITLIILSGCQPMQNDKIKQDELQNAKTSKNSSTLEQAFFTWKAKQDPILIKEYHRYVSSYLRQPPTEFELLTNQNAMPKECEWTRFAVPPKRYWQNIIQSLHMIERLYLSDYFQRYQITSSFRNPNMNACVRGAGKSKHLHNYAVDFQVLDINLNQPEQQEKLQKALCEFWKKEGKRYRMGLGIYHENRFHIDVQGYRTWGSDYSQKTSPCLKKIKQVH